MIYYYINNASGTDYTTSGDKSQPYKTLQYCLNNLIFTTDDVTIYLDAGTYNCDDSLAKIIPANISLYLIGTGFDTILCPDKYFGCAFDRWESVGTKDANLYINRMQYDVSNQYTSDTSNVMANNFYMNNVLITGKSQNVMTGLFSSYTDAECKFKNCLFYCKADVNVDVLFRCDLAPVTLENCYGRYAAGWGPSGKYDGSNLMIINSYLDNVGINTNAKYYITNNTVPKNVGLYYGDFGWIKTLIYSNKKYYNVSPVKYINGHYIETDLSSDDGFGINELVTPITVDGETFMPIEKFDNFKIVVKSGLNNSNSFLTMKMLKSDCELSVAKDSTNISIAETINNITLESKNNNQNIVKCGFSFDNGVTWHTIVNGQAQKLNINIPLKDYNTLTQEELEEWNHARDIIEQDGVLSSDICNIDFNNIGITYNSIRFAYALTKKAVGEVCELSLLKWNYDLKGSLRKMKDSEYEVDVFEHDVHIKFNITNDLVKINILV